MSMCDIINFSEKKRQAASDSIRAAIDGSSQRREYQASNGDKIIHDGLQGYVLDSQGNHVRFVVLRTHGMEGPMWREAEVRQKGIIGSSSTYLLGEKSSSLWQPF